MYALHSYVLSLGAVALAIVHLGGLLLQEREIAQTIPATVPARSLPEVEATGQEDADEGATAVA
jgi:cytochrome b6